MQGVQRPENSPEGKHPVFHETSDRVPKFAEFAKHGYAEVIPMPFYRAPNGSISRLTSQIKRFPTTVLHPYKWLHYDKQFSELSILAITLCIPVTFGFFMICFLDYAHIRSQRAHAD